jgi:hypothetical protein
MKRSPLQRKTPLKAKTPLKRTPLKARSSLPQSPRTPTKKKRSGFSLQVREQALSRDKGCVARGVWPTVRCFGRLHVHHVILRSQGGPDTLDNALVLCSAHHTHAHDVDRAGAEAAGIIRSAPPAALDCGKVDA